MFEISLSDFVDFTLKVGPAKLTKVRQLQRRGPYRPIQDFWRDLREAIVFHHESGNVDRDSLDFILLDQKRQKRERYGRALLGYKRFLGRKSPAWFAPPIADWQVGPMTVNVNPELGLSWNGQRHVIKLYFKEDDLNKRRIDTALILMEEVLRPLSPPDTCFSVLDVERGRLLTSNAHSADARPYLMGEASALVTMWGELTQGAPAGPKLVTPRRPSAPSLWRGRAPGALELFDDPAAPEAPGRGAQIGRASSRRRRAPNLSLAGRGSSDEAA